MQMPKFLWQFPKLLLLTLIVGVITSCGVSQEVKEDTAAVIGTNGFTDEYLDAVVLVMQSQKQIVEAFVEQNPEAESFTVVSEEGETFLVPIVDYIKALDILIEYRPKLKKALHALNRAIQTEKGISGFWEQFLRTLEDDSVGELFEAIGEE